MTDTAQAKRTGYRLAAAALALALSGCGTFSEPNEVLVSCPTTGVLAAAETLERYTPGSERDLTDLVVRARLGNVGNICSIFREERELEMDLLVDIAAERGPAAAEGQPVLLEYFVAVVDQNNRITSREEFRVAAAFEGTARQAIFNEELFLSIPIPAEKAVSDFRVILGLQLTQEELQRVLARDGRR